MLWEAQFFSLCEMRLKNLRNSHGGTFGNAPLFVALIIFQCHKKHIPVLGPGICKTQQHPSSDEGACQKVLTF